MSPATGGNITALDVTRDHLSPYRAQALNMSPSLNGVSQKDPKVNDVGGSNIGTSSQHALMRSSSGIIQFKNAIASIQ